jgi:hypothetical protein
MQPHSFLWHYLWLAPRVLQIIIAVIMVRRGLVREFPVFFAYTIFEAVEGGALFILDHIAAVSPQQYWSASSAGLGFDVTLRFAIIFEIFTNVFRNYPALKHLTRILFLGATAILLFAAVIVAALAPDDGTYPMLSRIHILDLSVVVMQSGLLLLLVAFASYFALSWRSSLYGIAFGLVTFACVRLATEATRVWTGSEAGFVFDFVSMATYHLCVVIWLVYLLAPEKARQPAKKLPENNLEHWNAELQRLLLR